MTCTEDQFRSILQAAAADITADSIPPLSLSDGHLTAVSRGRAAGGPRGRRQRWLIPLGAAAAVTAIAVAASVATSGAPPPGVNSGAARLWHGVPRYYFSVPLGTISVPLRISDKPVPLIVRDTSSGKILAIAHPPACKFAMVAAAADDRTAVVACQAAVPNGQGQARLFLARFDPGRDRLSVTALRLPQIPDFGGIALSQNGTKVAVTSGTAPRTAPNVEPEITLRVYTIASGAVRIWRGAGQVGAADLAGISWGAGASLAFGYDNSARPQDNGIRLLNTDGPGGSLLDASALAIPERQVPGGYRTVGHVAISGNGATLATVLAANSADPAGSEFAEFSVPAGQLLRRWMPSQIDTLELVVWSDFTGKTLVVSAAVHRGSRIISVLGIMKGARFTPLPRAPEVQGVLALSEIAF